MQRDAALGAGNAFIAPSISAAKIRIAVIGVGAFAQDQLAEFVCKLRKHSIILGSNLRVPQNTIPLIPEDIHVSKRHRLSNRRVFVDFSHAGTDLFDDFVPFEGYQMHRRVFAVIGAINEANEDNRLKFHQGIRRFPHLLANSLVLPSALPSDDAVREFVIDMVSAVVGWFGQLRIELYQRKHPTPLNLDASLLPRIFVKRESSFNPNPLIDESSSRYLELMKSRAEKLIADVFILAGHYQESISL